MSLCVAWKYEDRNGCSVYLAADSCAVVNTLVMPFSGIKVLEIPIRINSPTDGATHQTQELFNRTYGMAFAGSYLAAFLLKELVAEVLTHVQVLGSAEDISFIKICDLVLRFHKHFHEKIRSHLTADYEIDFFLAGYCPQEQKTRIAKFFVDSVANQPLYSEILTESGFSFKTIGIPSGRERFEELINLSLSAPPCRTHFAAFRRLWDVIRDPEIRFVDGVVQYGVFEDGNFKMVGAFDVKVENGALRSRMFVRGTNVEEINDSYLPQTLQIGYTYGNLFDEDIRSFDVGRTFWEHGGTRHVIDEQITLFPHDTRWERWYEDERNSLCGALCRSISIEHIGSTAVTGLAAVPVIDLMVGIEDLGDVQSPPFNLAKSGYEYLGDQLMVGQRSYRKRRDCAFNVHVVERNGEFWEKAIQLRDYLRQHSEECAAFSHEKIRIFNRGSWTLVRYLNERTNFYRQLVARATQNLQ